MARKTETDERKGRAIIILTALLLLVLGILIGLLVSAALGDLGGKREAKASSYRRLKAVTLSMPSGHAEKAPAATQTHAEASITVHGDAEVKLYPQDEKAAHEALESSGATEPAATETEPEATTPAPATPAPTEAPKEPESEWFWVLATAYSDSKNDTPTGCINDLPLTEGWSVAAVLEHLPYGTVLEIEGYGIRRVEDTASDKTISRRLAQISSAYPECETWIDIFIRDTEAVKAFGVRPLRIRIIND